MQETESEMAASLEDLRDEVDRNGGVLTTTMENVRNAAGNDRLGRLVRERISKDLAGLGIAHYPLELPDRYWVLVRLYKMGTPIADLIDAVLNPSLQHDAELREAAGGEAADLLQRVRELVCEKAGA